MPQSAPVSPRQSTSLDNSRASTSNSSPRASFGNSKRKSRNNKNKTASNEYNEAARAAGRAANVEAEIRRTQAQVNADLSRLAATVAPEERLKKLHQAHCSLVEKKKSPTNDSDAALTLLASIPAHIQGDKLRDEAAHSEGARVRKQARSAQIAGMILPPPSTAQPRSRSFSDILANSRPEPVLQPHGDPLIPSPPRNDAKRRK